jgi:AmiR/NasT family two-component response regulator
MTREALDDVSRKKMPDHSLQIAIVHSSAETRNTLHAAVSHLGHAVCLHAADAREFVEQAQKCRPDVIIVQEFLPDANGLEAANDVAGDDAIPMIVIIDRHNGVLLESRDSANVLAVLQEPVRSVDLMPIVPLAVQHFNRLQALRESIALFKEALADDS